MTPNRTFDIGLVMAGAISAGAYTAGVTNFLFEALNEWYTAKEQGNNVPPHDIKIKAISGASAGGMCAALSIISICEGTTEKFRKSWVEKIDIDRLLETSDVENATVLQSVLNCRVLDEIADYAIQVDHTNKKWYKYLDEEKIDIFLTATNLNGIAYGIDLKGAIGTKYIMANHADYIQFQLYNPHLSSLPQVPYPVKKIQVGNTATDKNWALLKNTALATGAVPFALLSRKLNMSQADYQHREWSSGFEAANPPNRNIIPLNTEPYDKPYLFVDGGMMNNEPFEPVRRKLAGSAVGRNPTDGNKATRAVLMIDPFPSEYEDVKYKELKQNLSSLIPYLYRSLRNQAKFKMEELLLAIDENIYSRFIIAPKRAYDTNNPPQKIIHVAGEVMGAFGGFFSQDFRQHDYELGRRNCQFFLKEHFLLPVTNPLFDYWSPQMRTDYLVTDANGKQFLPIIPLVTDKVKTEVPKPEWKKISNDKLKQIEDAIEKRVEKIVPLEVDEMVGGFLLNSILKGIFKIWMNDKLTEVSMKAIKAELEACGLY